MQSPMSSGAARLTPVPPHSREPSRVIVLPSGVDAMGIADRARDAFLAFLAGTEWYKRELAAWLTGPYRELTSYAALAPTTSGTTHATKAPSVRLVAAAPATRGAKPPLRKVLPARLDQMLLSAREEVLATLLMMAPPDSDVRFAERAIAAGHVVRTRAADGRAGWAPVDLPGMLLVDRLHSLVAVDYLMRPADYLALLSVCGVCQLVAFDAQVRVRGTCLKHRRSVGKIAAPR